MKLNQLIESVAAPAQVYHIMDRKHLTLVQQQGLVPQRKSNAANWNHINYGKPSTFVFSQWDKEEINEVLGMLSNKYLRPEDTEGQELWGDHEWATFVTAQVALVIDCSKCPNVRFQKDPNGGSWSSYLVTTDPIPPEAIVETRSVNFDWT